MQRLLTRLQRPLKQIDWKTVNTRFSDDGSNKRIKYSNTEKLFKIKSTNMTSRSISKETKSQKNQPPISRKDIIHDSGISVASKPTSTREQVYSTQPRPKPVDLNKMERVAQSPSPGRINFVELNRKRAFHFSKSQDRKKNKNKSNSGSDFERVMTPKAPQKLKGEEKEELTGRFRNSDQKAAIRNDERSV